MKTSTKVILGAVAAAAAAIKTYRAHRDKLLRYAMFPGDLDGKARRYFRARAEYVSEETLDEIRRHSLQEPPYVT